VWVAGDAFGFAEFFVEGFFCDALEAEVDGGGDGEAAELDVFFFEDDFEVAADGVHGVGFLVFAAPGGADFDGFGFCGIGFGAGDGFGGDHALEGGVAFAGGGFDGFEWVVGIGAADDSGEECGFGEGEL
jgi:hypothetical protein